MYLLLFIQLQFVSPLLFRKKYHSTFIINQFKIAVMDFLLSTGIRKMPKIPDKSNSYSFYSRKPSKKEFTSTLHDHHEDKIRLTTEKVDSVKTFNYII